MTRRRSKNNYIQTLYIIHLFCLASFKIENTGKSDIQLKLFWAFKSWKINQNLGGGIFTPPMLIFR